MIDITCDVCGAPSNAYPTCLSCSAWGRYWVDDLTFRRQGFVVLALAWLADGARQAARFMRS